MRSLIYTAKLDDRGGGRVHSRIGISGEARHFAPGDPLFTDISAEQAREPLHCVLIDEAQFLTAAQVRELGRVADDLGIPVLCYGLRTDFQGELFPGSAQLLAWADNLVELKTICHCGAKATMVVRGARRWLGRAHRRAGGNRRQRPLCAAVPAALCSGARGRSRPELRNHFKLHPRTGCSKATADFRRDPGFGL